MATSDPGLWGLAMSAAAGSAAWLVGEGGRIAVAGGAGGLTRWLNSERRRLRDGMIAVAGGVTAGYYLWPLTLAVVGAPFGGLKETPNNIVMAGYLAGMLGMSFFKILIAMVEARLARAVGGDENGK